MSRRVRLAVSAPALAALGLLFAWAIAGLPAFGSVAHRYGSLLNHIALPQRHATNVVNAIVFDYRGFDTMGEEFILFTAVLGVTLLLRQTERGEKAGGDDVGSDAVRVLGVLAVGLGVLVGLWVVAFGFVTPGGGFQGGVALAAGLVLIWLAAGYGPWTASTSPHALEPLEALGAGGYVLIGLAALVSGLPFLANLLGPGEPATLWSAGSAGLINWCVGLEVAAANLLLFREFLEEYIAPIGGSR